jgi:tRNA(Ile)-lysidine synthase
MARRRLEERFRENLRALGVADRPHRLLVALSGGRDSVVLLHLLRFSTQGLPLTLAAAHLDHAMREGSDADARWAAGLCRAWDVPFHEERCREPPRGEAEARRTRYAFLRRLRASTGSDLVATAHHADDQAETVLFRILRGTGLPGLAGITGRTDAGLLRPLLPFWRREVAEYAARWGLRWREDPGNRLPLYARNRIRLDLLPRIERTLAPQARRSLVRLADLAREAEQGWDAVVDRAAEALARPADGAVLLARHELREYDSAVASRVLRKLLRRFGIVLGRTGTRTALQFITHAESGRELRLPGGVRILAEFEAARIERVAPAPVDRPLEIPLCAQGAEFSGTAEIGGRRRRVRAWAGSPAEAPHARWRVAIDPAAVRFPLVLRGRRAGDRVRTAGGTKTLKKLFIERRVPRSARARVPVFADATGAVLWVALSGVPAELAPADGNPAFTLAILDD